MNTQILVAFIIGRIILSASPGTGVITSVLKAVSDGFKNSFYFLVGIIICNIIYLLVAIYGISSFINVLGEMSVILKIIGGIYLLILGIRIFNKKLDINNNVKNTGYKNIFGGFLITVGNPEPILFYASVVPALLSGKRIMLYDSLLLIIILVSVSILITGSYCYAASVSKDLFYNTKFFRNINKIAGSVMCIIGTFILINIR